VREVVVVAVVCTLSDSAGPVELKRATLGSEDRPRVGVDRGLGARGQKKRSDRGLRAATVGSQGWPCFKDGHPKDTTCI
jgi:hypothetical protein